MGYTPPKKNTEYILYVGLESVATAGAFQSSATIASGDFKTSGDGGALGNLTTLPTVTPAAGKMVKITLSAAEMNYDNVTVVCSDASGAEWKDLIINIQPSVRQIDDLATPTNITAGTITTVTNLTNAPTAGDLTPTMKTSVTTAATASTPTAAAVTGNIGGNVGGSVASVTAGVTLANGAITAAVIATDAIDADALAANAVTEIQSGLATLAALFGYDMESGKTFAQAVLDIWATRVGDATSNSAATPTLITYDSPDGTVQVTHTHTTTSRVLA